VSVIIPAYNSAATVAACVESCLAQRHDDFEVVVVDDGSRDATPDVLARFGERIRFIRQPNGGIAAARNAGVRAARGDYIAWMDNDDLMHPDRLRLQEAVLEAHPDVMMVCSDFTAFTDEREDLDPSYIATYYRAAGRDGGLAKLYSETRELVDEKAGQHRRVTVRLGDVYEQLVDGNFVHPPTVMVRRAAFERAGAFDESIRVSCDYDMVVRIARTGRVAHIDAPLLRYRLSETQVSRRARATTPLDTVAILEKVRREDPSFYARNAARMRRRTGAALVEAAYWCEQKAKGVGLLWWSLAYRPSPVAWVYAFARLLTPRSLVQAVKGLFRSGQSIVVLGMVPGL
jgi:glycosyltransferase involved in cell wall biosynthesis